MMPSFHPSTFEYLKPTDYQLSVMSEMRTSFTKFALHLDAALPAGPDKTYILRNLRGLAMWVNIAITRHPDGSPRTVTDEITP